MTTAGGYLYVFGGCGAEGRMKDLHKFDPKTSKWTKLASFDKIKGRGGAVF
jgi:N-acetylneuraminic acid mutarotase